MSEGSSRFGVGARSGSAGRAGGVLQDPSEEERGCFALFGGSFDPPHVSHVLVASYVLSVAAVEGVIVVPAYKHPLEKRASASFEERVHMCELAFADLRRVEISRVEEELGGESRTLLVVEELIRRDPDRSYRLVMGSDLLGEIDRWHAFDRLAAIAPPFVVTRAGFPAPGIDDAAAIPAVSSTMVRDRLRQGVDANGIVPRAVLAYAIERGLYREAP